MPTGHPTRTITRINTAADGSQANGDMPGLFRLSPDGTRVLFASNATNLVPGDTNGLWDLFVKDLTTGAITRVNTAADGTQELSDGHFGTTRGDFSTDGTQVVFYSSGGNFVPGDTNGTMDVFVKDLATGAITRASTAADGAPATGGFSAADEVTHPVTGTRVLFLSTASDLVPDDPAAPPDTFISHIYLKDLATGAITRVDTAADGTAADTGVSFRPVIPLQDGTLILFASQASNLVAGDTSYSEDIFLKNLTTGAVTCVSSTANGDKADGDSTLIDAIATPTGARVLFTSNAANLAPGAPGRQSNLYVKDLATGTVTRIATVSSPQADGIATWARPGAFSPDGSKLVFASSDNTLVPDDTNTGWDYFVADIATAAITRINTAADGSQATNPTEFFPIAGPINPFITTVSFAPDGSRVIFSSTAPNLVPGDTNGVADFFIKDLATGTITRVNTAEDGTQANAYGSFDTPYFTPDGTRLMMLSAATNLVPGDTNGIRDLFIQSLAPPAITLAIAAPQPVQPEGDAGTTPYSFTVTRTGDLTGPTTAAWSVHGAGPQPADAADFAGNTLPSGTIAFAPGETTQAITVSVAGDTAVEGAEGFALAIADPTASLAMPTAAATIASDDAIADLTVSSAGLALAATPEFYAGPVAGPVKQWITDNPAGVIASASGPGWYIRTGAGSDAIAASSGTNVLDGGAGSNLLTGGTGPDTFFIDTFFLNAANPSTPTWSTITNLAPGDAITLWGIDTTNFALIFEDNQGAPGLTGLTLHAFHTSDPAPRASLTLAGHTIADLYTTLTQSFGHDPASNTPYLHIAHL